jgi:hypothetical protein
MKKLRSIENKYHILLPEIYRAFFNLCSSSIPANLVGTDLWNNNRFDLNQGAVELLEEDGVNNFLESNDFVFIMHQGYMFWKQTEILIQLCTVIMRVDMNQTTSDDFLIL